MPYFPSGRNALCAVRDAHRCSAVVVESYEPYSPSGGNALCVVRDAHRCIAVVVGSYVPYFRSDRDALSVVRDAHRYSTVVVESCVPYSPSGRNALCIVRDAHRCSAVVELTQLTFVPKQAIRRRCWLLIPAPRTLQEDSRRARRAEKRDSKPIKDTLETNSKLVAKASALVGAEPTE